MIRVNINNDLIIERCIKIFTNLGWSVECERTIEGLSLRPDIVLSFEGKTYGYVEVVGDKDIDIVVRKKEEIAYYLENNKPEIFILTNGIIFDIFYEGRYSNTLTVPPSPENYKAYKRLNVYFEKLQGVKKKSG